MESDKFVSLLFGDVTNNVAEYEGILSCLRHARLRGHTRVCFRVDSLLIANHVLGQWACRATYLTPHYTEALMLLRVMKDASCEITIQHVYREYNSDADSLANYAIDAHDPVLHAKGVVVNEA